MKKITKFTTMSLISFALILSACSKKDDSENATKEQKQLEPIKSQASQELKPDSNQLKAQSLYEQGLGFLKGDNKDTSKAFELIKKANELGSLKAQYNLALLYASGVGTTKDLKKAFELYSLAAERGSVVAQRYLGSYYSMGIGTKLDPDLAFKWTKLSADAKDAKALYNLSILYTKGIGTKQDSKLALQYLILAANAGNDHAQLNLAVRLLKDNSKANAKASYSYMKLSAEQGNLQAIYNLGVYYDKAIGTPKDNKAAIKCFVVAAKNGHKKAIEIVNSLSKKLKAQQKN